MKKIKISMNEERKLITNLIVSDRFCKEIIPLLRTNYLKSSYARETATWIIEYYEQFKKAPGKDIKSIYHVKRALIKDAETVDNISSFLSSISKDYETSIPNNIEYEIAQTVLYLKTCSLSLLKDSLDESVLENDPLKGEQAISNFKRVEKPLGQGVSLLRDTNKVIDAFMDEEEVLFNFPGALGKVAGALHRGDFLSFLAPMKRGKTWFLWFTAETGLHFHLKVLFFTLEMTENQIIRRSWKSLIGHPKVSGIIRLPYFILDDESNKFKIGIRKKLREGIDPSEVANYQKKFKRKFRKGDVRIISLPSKSATVSDLSAHLDNMQYYENFIPDIIVIDYADILAQSKGIREYRHGLDDIWAGLRRMAQERQALVVTATQTEKGTFNHDIGESSVAEDIRKIAHITCGLALNQTKQEAENGIIRVSQIVTREERKAFQQAVVLQCLDIGRPCLDSKLANEVLKKVEKVEEKTGYTRKTN